ncbi:class I SAM-dependent methyltransferase [Halocatena pleomorpha]|uniref:site-specific DNA-methyltransferase (cytosine-N(4)-specific) n=1 Tax=Halocatena pleomorpha TaxID=1785090 RepID=A0A3P3RFQ3_9EURY|nr:adenine-specific DNA methylase [Halocatena pleomorpha]RRJ32347.1 adenine-specific DNA methylase [Halocatena pleomorpha]
MTDQPRDADGSSLGESSITEIDWTFSGADTRRLTHGMHSYPARMIPQIPATVLAHFKRKGVIREGDTVYDPFSGSGTTAVEGRLAGLHAEANDINPLACLLTLAKSRPIDPEPLETACSELTDGLKDELREVRSAWETGDCDLDSSAVREGWFPEPQLYELVAIRNRIDELRDELAETMSSAVAENTTRFLRVALSVTVRRVSYQRNGEYKRYRMPPEDRADHDPNVYTLFVELLRENAERMRSYSRRVDRTTTTTVHYADARLARAIEDNSADIVITSPPYGDHPTTVAYGQFSQDPAIIADQRGYEEMRAVDKTGLGGAHGLEPVAALERYSPSLESTLNALRKRDGRATDALSFFSDLYAVIEQVRRVLKSGQPVVWVLANRTMSRVPIPTHLIATELCEQFGFEREHVIPREIPTKTLPWENAPENVAGRTGEMMASEYVVIMRCP